LQKIISELRFTAGSLLELIVLKMISGHAHSVEEIFNELREIGFVTPKGSIYPLISRLRSKGYILSGREESESGGAIKTYDLTEIGRARLAELRKDWKRLNDVIAGLGR